jgi:hypothetical protein
MISDASFEVDASPEGVWPAAARYGATVIVESH